MERGRRLSLTINVEVRGQERAGEMRVWGAAGVRLSCQAGGLKGTWGGGRRSRGASGVRPLYVGDFIYRFRVLSVGWRPTRLGSMFKERMRMWWLWSMIAADTEQGPVLWHEQGCYSASPAVREQLMIPSWA